MKSAIEEYLGALDELTGGLESENVLVTEEYERPPLWVFIYRDLLGEGNLTSFTYGVSSSDHPSWVRGKPELVISVDSPNREWALAMGEVARQLRDRTPLSYGEIVKWGRPIAVDSGMSAFLIFSPSVLDEQQRRVVVSDTVINIAQLYPIYEEEVELLEASGPEALFRNERYDPYSVKRPSLLVWDR